MKTLITYTILALGCLYLTSCDNSEGYFDDYNEKPTITIKKELGAEYFEDLKDSLKLGDNSYTFSFKIEDEEENLIIEASCENENVVITQDKNEITIESSEIGVKEISLITKDAFGLTDECIFSLEVFDNIKPTANFEVELSDALLDPYERIINASSSFDDDLKFGGGITDYQFRIDNQAIIDTKENFINHIFKSQGTYQISVKVKDNNGEWSEAKIQSYTVK